MRGRHDGALSLAHTERGLQHRAGQSMRRCVQVQRQIEQMVMFIKQEADEKANEISMSAEEVRRGMDNGPQKPHFFPHVPTF